jgi:hypothetical protein
MLSEIQELTDITVMHRNDFVTLLGLCVVVHRNKTDE